MIDVFVRVSQCQGFPGARTLPIIFDRGVEDDDQRRRDPRPTLNSGLVESDIARYYGGMYGK